MRSAAEAGIAELKRNLLEGISKAIREMEHVEEESQGEWINWFTAQVFQKPLFPFCYCRAARSSMHLVFAATVSSESRRAVLFEIGCESQQVCQRVVDRSPTIVRHAAKIIRVAPQY